MLEFTSLRFAQQRKRTSCSLLIVFQQRIVRDTFVFARHRSSFEVATLLESQPSRVRDSVNYFVYLPVAIPLYLDILNILLWWASFQKTVITMRYCLIVPSQKA